MARLAYETVVGSKCRVGEAAWGLHLQVIPFVPDVLLDEPHRVLAASVEDVANHAALVQEAGILAAHEAGHAFGHMDFLKEVGDPVTGVPMGNTDANLKSAIEGETYEYTQMYPGMARTARDEGFPELAEWFETLAKAERSHANRFQKGLDTLKG